MPSITVVSLREPPPKRAFDFGSILPSLKDAPREPPRELVCRATTDEYDEFRRSDDMLYLRLGQGAIQYQPKGRCAGFEVRSIEHDDVVNGVDADARSIAETDYGDDDRPRRRRDSTRFFSSLSPPPVQDTRHSQPEVELGSSQRDVYDISPPPGFKRLKRVPAHAPRVSDCHFDGEIAITGTSNQLLFPPEGHLSRLQRARRGRVPPSFTKRSGRAAHQPRARPTLPTVGDGFSSDETRPQKKQARALRSTPRSRPKKSTALAGSKREATDSSGSSHSLGHGQSSFLSSFFTAGAGPAPPSDKKRRHRGEPGILALAGSLDVVSLSQEELRAAQEAEAERVRAAREAEAKRRHAAEKSKAIAKTFIPLRPQWRSPRRKSPVNWSLGLDDLAPFDDDDKENREPSSSQGGEEVSFEVHDLPQSSAGLLPSLRRF